MFDAKFLFNFSLYHQHDVNLLICQGLYKTRKRDISFETLILLKEEPPDESLISSIPARCVKENASFVVDTNKLKSVNDILADDTGTWLSNGQHKFHYRKNIYGEKYIKAGRGKYDSSDIGITVHRHYYQHKSAKDFRKTITFLTGIFHSNIAETAFKANRKYCLCLKCLFFTTYSGQFWCNSNGAKGACWSKYLIWEKKTG